MEKVNSFPRPRTQVKKKKKREQVNTQKFESSKKRNVNLLKRREARVMVLRRHGHRREHRRRGRRAVRCAGGARVVLASAPGKTNSRVADGVALHLVDSHLSGVALNELDETAALSGGDLDVSDFSKPLEERAQLVLSNVTRKTTDEDSGVVGIRELVHGLRSAVVAHRRSTHGVHAHLRRSTTGHGRGITGANSLGRGGRDAHGAVAAVDALHLGESTVLVLLVGEADKSVAARHAADGIGHDLGRLARGEAGLEKRNQNVFVDLGAEIADEDGVFGTAVVTAVLFSPAFTTLTRDQPSISESTTRRPVELEGAGAVRNLCSVEGESLGSRGGVLEFDEAVSGITTENS